MEAARHMISDEVIVSKIYVLREQRVMLDRDLAVLYGVETKALKQAVRRNISRFPRDFMFVMSKDELEKWRSRIVTSTFHVLSDTQDISAITV